MGVDIVILTKNKTDYLFKCLTSIIEHTSTNYHVYIGDTGSDPEELSKMGQFCKDNFPDKNITLLRLNYYSFSKNNNYIIKNICKQDVVVLCNNDIELRADCISAMEHEIRSDDNIGTVGCRLQYPTGTVQHAGQTMFIDENNMKRVSHRGWNTTLRFKDRESVLGNTGALLCTRKQDYIDLDGLSEVYIECFEDLQYNIELLLRERVNIYLDNVYAIHHESQTRLKNDESIAKLKHDLLNVYIPWFDSLPEDKQTYIINDLP